jgi:phosphoglycolate phosphatase
MTSPPRFDLVLFDLDGTLADTAPDIAHALNVTLVEAGLPPHPLSTVISYVGDGAPKLIERALPPTLRGQAVGPLLERFLLHYEARACVDSRLYPGITEFLQALAQAGVNAAVLTNKTGKVARQLVDALWPASGFLAVVGDGDGYPRKPDPTAARALVERCGTVPARTVMVGDGVPDVQVARALGCSAVAAAWGYSSRARLQAEAPTWIADSPEDARKLVLPPGVFEG